MGRGQWRIGEGHYGLLLAAWWRERVSDEFHFFPVSFIICQASASCWRYSREVTDHSSALLDRYVVINSLQKQKINARNESKKSPSEGMTFELRPEGQEVMFQAEGDSEQPDPEPDVFKKQKGWSVGLGGEVYERDLGSQITL